MQNREPHFSQFALSELMPFAERFPLNYVKGKGNIKIAYRHFTHQQNGNGRLVILVNGRAENLLKWTEVAFDFYHHGYDVLTFDHRGQGYSERLLADKDKGYIDEFRFYTEDMARVIQEATDKCEYKSLHLVAHSLGALISSYYLANYDHHIQSAVLSSPCYGLPLKHPIRDQLLISLMMLFGQGERYVPGKKGYQPANLNSNELSFCKTRMKWMNRINRNHPDIHLGGPTFRWVHLCLSAIKGLSSVIPRIEIPMMILYSDKEKIVDNKNLAKLTALFPQAKLVKMKNTKHEILFERDQLRHCAITKILDFFE
ncbi:alpha/beta fold hydrolase [Mannheimia massilioguelmaensis]|uniref:alpha/beta fold hydrolase n=1 Tax=Mannheimia massilioguelmaensis TaxID=1604354 RepID=UPI0005CB361C|nr:alpha/beta hydrolase [Mannheimia massilioguelmaensis]